MNIHTPLSPCAERDARHAGTDRALNEIEALLSQAVNAEHVGDIATREDLIAAAVAIADASVTGDQHRSHVIITRRMFQHRLAGWKPCYKEAE